MTVKETAIRAPQQLPEDASWDDIQERFNFMAGVGKGLRELDQGKGVAHSKVKNQELRPEYRREDLGQGVRGKNLESHRSGTNLVLLSPDVAEAFPTEKEVNDALRSLIRLAKRSVDPSRLIDPQANSRE